jgi:ubiquitin C-terminal hydrolase
MKTPELQRSHTTEERGPSILQVAEEKTTKINIYNNHPMKYNGSPFESRTNDRKKYPNEDAFIPLSKDQSESNSEISSKRSDHVYKKQKRDERINYISEPYYNTYNEKKPQNKNQKRQRNIEENNKKSKESPENSRGGKHRKKRQINVQIDKLEEPSNNFRKRKKNLSKNDEYIYYCEIPSEEDSFMNNVSFSNKNIDTNFMNTINNIPKQKKNDDKIDPKILKQFKILSELENSKIIKKLEKEKQKLNEENKKLNKDYSNFEKERQKFEQEKKLFFESRDRVINDSRKNEERLIQLENELQNKFLEKKNEIQQMREQLKQEQFNLDNERNKMRDNYQIRLSKLEEDYKIKEETQNYNNNLNIDKTRKEQELLRQKEKEVNELQKAFQEKEDNLNQRENELINKENELQEKEADLNEKYQNLLEKEKNLMGEKQQFMNNNEENQKDLYLKSQQLNNKEQELINRENMLQDKENEIKNRENKIYDVENNLKNREDLLNETQNKIFNQQNQINDREKKLDLLNKEIKDKRNQIIELNHTYNDMMSKLNSPQKENNNLESSKGSKEINADINNFDIMNRPSITAVRKLDKKFNPNNSANAENQPINKVVTFGQNQSSLASNYSNNKRDIRDNDSYPENNLKDIKDNDAFPENHLHDIQDNDEYPENHGEDDFIYGNKDNANNNMNNEEYEEIAEDFDQYINNQSQNEKSQNMNTNKNNMNLPMDEPEENKKDENQNDDNTEPFNFYQENNNDLMQSKNNESKNDIKDNILPDNNDMINGNENLNNDMNKLNESESGEIDLNNLHNEDLDIEGSQNKNDLNNQNANKISNEHENEINDIVEELFVEEYNPSLGLMKMENPSYLNSFIQCFAHIPDITNKVINLHLDENFSKTLPNLKLTKNYRNLLINCFFPEKLFNMEKQAYNPTKFRNAINELNPLFQNNNEIELKEYINFFILKLHDELNTKKDALSQNNEMNNNEPEIKNENEELISFLKSFTEKNNSIISKTLYGITKYTLYCNQCQNTFYNFHCYSHLYFNLDNVLDYKINRYHREDLDLNLNDCLDYYQKAETLRGDNGIFCPSCKVQTESTSIKNIYSTKNVIIFILDRNSGDKFNQTFINFDEILNLRDYVEYKKEGEKHREKFFLGGVINYYVGDDEQNGTYNAFVRMGKRSDWYCYEDENVYSVTLDDIKNNGYPVVLFYHKLTKK